MTDTVKIFLGDLKCELQRFNPKPGDVFVLTVPGPVPAKFADQLIARWNVELPNNKIAVIADGMRIALESKG